MEPIFARSFSHDLERAYSYIDQLCLHICFHLVHECRLLEPEIEPLDHLVERIGVSSRCWSPPSRRPRYPPGRGLRRVYRRGLEEPTGRPPDHSSELQQRAREACAGATPIFDMLERCHQHAVGFLTGRTAGFGTIFPRGNMDLWERLHTDDTVMSIYADLIVPALDAALVPRMRILEVGGGVGAVLRRSLARLQRSDIKEYLFTDLGQHLCTTLVPSMARYPGWASPRWISICRCGTRASHLSPSTPSSASTCCTSRSASAGRCKRFTVSSKQTVT